MNWLSVWCWIQFGTGVYLFPSRIHFYNSMGFESSHLKSEEKGKIPLLLRKKRGLSTQGYPFLGVVKVPHFSSLVLVLLYLLYLINLAYIGWFGSSFVGNITAMILYVCVVSSLWAEESLSYHRNILPCVVHLYAALIQLSISGGGGGGFERDEEDLFEPVLLQCIQLHVSSIYYAGGMQRISASFIQNMFWGFFIPLSVTWNGLWSKPLLAHGRWGNRIGKKGKGKGEEKGEQEEKEKKKSKKNQTTLIDFEKLNPLCNWENMPPLLSFLTFPIFFPLTLLSYLPFFSSLGLSFRRYLSKKSIEFHYFMVRKPFFILFCGTFALFFEIILFPLFLLYHCPYLRETFSSYITELNREYLLLFIFISSCLLLNMHVMICFLQGIDYLSMWGPVLFCFIFLPSLHPSLLSFTAAGEDLSPSYSPPPFSFSSFYSSLHGAFLAFQIIFALVSAENYNINIPPFMSCPMFSVVKPMFGRDHRVYGIREPGVPRSSRWEYFEWSYPQFKESTGIGLSPPQFNNLPFWGIQFGVVDKYSEEPGLKSLNDSEFFSYSEENFPSVQSRPIPESLKWIQPVLNVYLSCVHRFRTSLLSMREYGVWHFAASRNIKGSLQECAWHQICLEEGSMYYVICNRDGLMERLEEYLKEPPHEFLFSVLRLLNNNNRKAQWNSSLMDDLCARHAKFTRAILEMVGSDTTSSC